MSTFWDSGIVLKVSNVDCRQSVFRSAAHFHSRSNSWFDRFGIKLCGYVTRFAAQYSVSFNHESICLESPIPGAPTNNPTGKDVHHTVEYLFDKSEGFVGKTEGFVDKSGGLQVSLKVLWVSLKDLWVSDRICR